MDPLPVHVSFPNGFEELGLAIAPDVVEVGAIGLQVELRDVIVIDGARREVVGVSHTMRRPHDPATQGMEHAARLTHRAAP